MSNVPVGGSRCASRNLDRASQPRSEQRPRALTVLVFVASKRSVLHHARSICVHVSHLPSSSFLFLFPFSSSSLLKKCLGLPLLIFLLVVRARVLLTEARTLPGPRIWTIMVQTLTGATGTPGTGKEHTQWKGTVQCTIMADGVVVEVQTMVRHAFIDT